MKKKKTLVIGLAVIAVCMAVVLVYGLMNRTTKREPTQQERENCAPYTVDWQDATGQSGTDAEIILSLCTFAEEQTIGENRYKSYTPDTLGEYLHQCGEILSVSLYLNAETGAEETLYIQYNDAGGDMVILGYDLAEGLIEMGIFDPDTDTFYHDLRGSVEVWEKFAGGVRWGLGE